MNWGLCVMENQNDFLNKKQKELSAIEKEKKLQDLRANDYHKSKQFTVNPSNNNVWKIVGIALVGFLAFYFIIVVLYAVMIGAWVSSTTSSPEYQEHLKEQEISIQKAQEELDKLNDTYSESMVEGNQSVVDAQEEVEHYLEELENNASISQDELNQKLSELKQAQQDLENALQDFQ